MKKSILFVAFSFQYLFANSQTTLTIMDSVIFFDGYATVVSTPPPPAGVIRHRNDLYARKLNSSEIASLGSTLQMNIEVSALCDNYDRIGNVNLALVPTGSTTYNPDNVEHIEIGRFITPFMNKNIPPTTVPYTFNIDNLALILKDVGISSTYDFWIELSIFGVPYAANVEVAGCSGRNDVFMAKLSFETDAATSGDNTNRLLPIFFKNSFNNYQVGATDTIGQTVKTITFNVPDDLSDAALFLITSNHGANAGGEEYNRRFHYAYFDDNLMLTYKPGRLTCEPFRVYNTQANGIYGANPRTPAQWQSFSNWCPGDVIDIRRINLGALSSGNHTFKITVPDAVFNGGQGDIPLSLYLQGKTSGLLPLSLTEKKTESELTIYPNPSSGTYTIKGFDLYNSNFSVYNAQGKHIKFSYEVVNEEQIDLKLEDTESGAYFLVINNNQFNQTLKIHYIR